MLANGYMYINTPKGPVLEHRIVMARIVGRPLRKDEDVHHINGIRTDNREGNLLLLSHASHTRLHASEGK